jgi:hypothetical protein
MENKIKLAFITLLIYGVPLFIWSTVPFSNNIWGSYSSSFIFSYLFLGKVVFVSLGVIFDLLLLYAIYLLLRKNRPIENERSYLIYQGLKKILKWVFAGRLKTELGITKEEKISVLFYMVKLVFTPVMIKFLIDNTFSFLNAFVKFSPTKVSDYLSLAFYLILVLDTLIFACGYVFESPKLKNVVRSVEPTAFGWLVALICYPPINDFSGKILGWYTSDFSNFGNQTLTTAMGFLSILLFSIYVWASLSLGTKASNLTNRGIVSKGPYKYVRHPAYISKNLSWWIMAIPSIQASGFIAIFSLSAWSIIYFFRAITEERHLLQDADYVEYSKKVKYMFIPGVF